MNVFRRCFCCLLGALLLAEGAVWAQPVPLLQVQQKAQEQLRARPWIENDILKLAAGAAGGAGLSAAVYHMRLRALQQRAQQEKDALSATLKQEARLQQTILNNDLKTARHTITSLKTQRRKIVKQYNELQAALRRSQQLRAGAPHTRLPLRATGPLGEGYLHQAKTQLAKDFLKSDPVHLKYLKPEDINTLIKTLDETAAVSAREGTAGALRFLNHQAQRAARNVPLMQVYIEAGRTLKVVAVGVVLTALLLPSADAQAAAFTRRLQANPALFLSAAPDQIARLAADPVSDGACRRIARAVDELSKLEISPDEAASLVQQALYSMPGSGPAPHELMRSISR